MSLGRTLHGNKYKYDFFYFTDFTGRKHQNLTPWQDLSFISLLRHSRPHSAKVDVFVVFNAASQSFTPRWKTSQLGRKHQPALFFFKKCPSIENFTWGILSLCSSFLKPNAYLGYSVPPRTNCKTPWGSSQLSAPKHPESDG